MVEAIMYAAIGFLAASLFGLGVMPLVHARAQRLTAERIQSAIPFSLADVEIEKDLLRADYAMATRKLELDIERMRHRLATSMVELSQKTDAANRLRQERDAYKVENMMLRAQLATAGEGTRPAEAPAPRFRKRYSAASSSNAA